MLKIKNVNEKINYVGNFETFSKEGEVIKCSQNKGDYVELNFIGNKIRFYTHTNAWRGKANIYIDDIRVDIIDTYSQKEMMDVLAYESEELEYGNHKIKIEVLGEKREAASEPKIAVYRFEVDEEKNNNLDLAELKAIVAELKRENEGLKASVESLNAQISELQAELNIKIEEIANKDGLLTEKENIISTKDDAIANLQSELKIKIKEVDDKDLLLAEQNKEVTRLQEQASLKLDEVKAIIEELKGLIVNA